MSGFQLTASLASSLVWPLIIVLILIFLWRRRTELSKFLDQTPISRGRAVRRIKAGPLELEWDQLVETTNKNVQGISSPALRLGGIPTDLRQMAREDPAAAVLVAFTFIEDALSKLLPDSERLSIARKVEIAYKTGLIPEQVWTIINNLIALRSQAAHRVGEADINSEHAYQYLNLANAVYSILSEIANDKRRAAD
jgi:hypothetical protein